jgi:hypothetical protein
MSNLNAHIANGNKVTIFTAGGVFQANNTPEIEAALAAGDYDLALSYVNKASGINRKSEGSIIVEHGVVFYRGNPVHNVVTDRILDFYDRGLPFAGLLAFLENLLSNPSKRAVDELYDFLAHRSLPITSDGCFLAYKGVRSDYYSKTGGKLTLLKGTVDSSGHIFNGVGEEIECVRNEVDDEKDRTCSNGLHVGALKYATDFGRNGRVVVVKVNPKDAVSVPSDHNAEKLRVCAYSVVADFDTALNEPLVEVGGKDAKASWIRPRDKSGRFLPKR